MKNRVVITGMEIVSSIGNTLDSFWQSASSGSCGIKKIQKYDPSPYPTQVAGEITGFDEIHLESFPKLNRFPMAARYAFYAAYNAINQSGLQSSELQKAGVFLGTSVGGSAELEHSAYTAFLQQNWKKMPALSVIKAMPNAIANQIAINFGLYGPNTTFSNACISSAEAIGTAFQQIKHGVLPLALCGGTESLVWEVVMAAWCKLRVMSTQNEQPEIACRPFDKARDGMVMAEGAGILVLESLEHAKARGAKIYAEIIGYGASCDAFHITAPQTAGQTRAIHAALDDARLNPGDVQYINAHGTGTQLNDKIETATIKNVFKSYATDIPITALKSMTGHAIGAAGVIDIIATTLCFKNHTLLPTINLQNPDSDCDLDYIANFARKKTVDIALSNHFAFGGANAALLLQRY